MPNLLMMRGECGKAQNGKLCHRCTCPDSDTRFRTNKKHAVFRAQAEEQARGTYLTGRDGYVGYWDPEKDQEGEVA